MELRWRVYNRFVPVSHNAHIGYNQQVKILQIKKSDGVWVDVPEVELVLEGDNERETNNLLG